MKAIKIVDDFCKSCDADVVVCADPVCASGREVSYLSLITDVTVSGIDGPELTVILNAATFINLLTANVAVYEIDFNDGAGYHVITVGNPEVLNVAILADGIYIGNIREVDSGAISEFWYVVDNGLVAAYVEQRTIAFNYSLGCELYPNYLLELTDTTNIQGQSINPYKFELSEIKILNVMVNSEVYEGVNSYNENSFLNTNLDTLFENIVANNMVDGVGEIQNVGIFKTRCIGS